MTKSTRWLVVEVAAEPRPAAFRQGPLRERAIHAPGLKGVCLVDARGEARWFHSARDWPGLFRELQASDELVSWGGNGFGFLVLRRLFGAQFFPIHDNRVKVAWARHTDLREVIADPLYSSAIGIRRLARLSLGASPGIRAPSMARSRQAALEHCHRHAALVARLWKTYLSGDGLVLSDHRVLFHSANENRPACWLGKNSNRAPAKRFPSEKRPVRMCGHPVNSQERNPPSHGLRRGLPAPAKVGAPPLKPSGLVANVRTNRGPWFKP